MFIETTTLLLAQEPPLTGLTGAPPLGGTGGGGGGTAARSDGAGGGGGGLFIFILFGLLIFALIIPSVLANRRERKRREQMLGALRKHDRVQTIGGIIGSVVELKPNTVVLKVDESSNTRMTFARTAIQQVLTESPDKDGAIAAPEQGHEGLKA